MAADADRGGADVVRAADEKDAVADRLADMDAAEAVLTLDGDFAEGKMPVSAGSAFPGPVAEAYYWDDSDVVGIQGPVGSGKTTTKNKRKARRAMMMPRSTKELYVADDGADLGWRQLSADEVAAFKAMSPEARATVYGGAAVTGIRRYKVLYIRQTYRQLWSTTIPSYLETFPKSLGEWSGGRGDPVRHRIEFDDGTGPIEFIAEFMAFGDDIIASMRGVQTTDIDLNEADTMPVEILTVGIGRIDRWPGRDHFEGYPPELRSWGQVDCDFNAPDEDNWTFDVFHDKEKREAMGRELSQGLPAGAKPIRITFFNQPGFGEPGCENLQNLSASYYPRQIAAMKLAGRGDMIARLVYNKTVYLRAGDPVFSREFNRRLHVAETTIPPEPGIGLRIGLDQGFKGAAVIAQFLSPFHWRILAELHFPTQRLMAREFGRRLAELLETRFPGYRIEGAWADMAGEQGASQAAEENATWNKLVGQAAGFRVRPQKIGTNRIQPRLEAIRAPLEFIHGGQPGLLIDPSCKFLIRGFEARYVWKDEVDQNGDKRKVPDKSLTEANVMDAAQYLLLSEHRLNGLSPISFPAARNAPEDRGRLGHNGGPPLKSAGGLSTGYDPLNPYGE